MFDKKNRRQFLEKLYDVTNGSELYNVNMFELGKELNLEQEDILNIVNWLKGEGLIEPRGFKIIAITHHGILEVEKTKENRQHTSIWTKAEVIIAFVVGVVTIVSIIWPSALINLFS